MGQYKPLLLFVGKSGSGKTTIANELEQRYNMKQVYSYTTRPKRYEDEIGHTFITETEYMSLNNIIASTYYNGYYYCATKEQLDNADIYVVDVNGVKELLNLYDSSRPIIICYFDCPLLTKVYRMTKRGDTLESIKERIDNDEQSNWSQELLNLFHKYNNIGYVHIDGSQDIDTIIEHINTLF